MCVKLKVNCGKTRPIEAEEHCKMHNLKVRKETSAR